MVVEGVARREGSRALKERTIHVSNKESCGLSSIPGCAASKVLSQKKMRQQKSQDANLDWKQQSISKKTIMKQTNYSTWDPNIYR